MNPEVNSGAKKIALVLHSLSKKDQRWFLSQLEAEASVQIDQYLRELSKKRNLKKLAFSDLLELSGNKTVVKALNQQQSFADRLTDYEAVQIEEVLKHADSYTKWLLMSCEKLPHRTRIAKALSPDDMQYLHEKQMKNIEAPVWLREQAAAWVVKELTNESI